jgi:hypothetical protein
MTISDAPIFLSFFCCLVLFYLGGLLVLKCVTLGYLIPLTLLCCFYCFVCIIFSSVDGNNNKQIFSNGHIILR